MARMDSLEPLMIDELKDLLDAEKQITKALPKMARLASTDELRAAFEGHLRQTEDHLERLNEIASRLSMDSRGKKCIGMQGLIEEGQKVIEEADDEATRDAALIASAQKVEHYEIAAYGTVRTFANLLGHSEVARLLQQTLEEEKQTDQRLTTIAEEWVNQAAASGDEVEAEAEQGEAARLRGSRQIGGHASKSKGVAAETSRRAPGRTSKGQGLRAARSSGRAGARQSASRKGGRSR